MFISDIKRVIDQVSRDKGIDRAILIEALEEAVESAARKKYGNRIDIEVQYDPNSGELEVFLFKEVTDQVEDDVLEISLEEGKKLDPECQLGDSLGTKMDAQDFGRIAAQSAKQVIIQKLKEAEKNAVYENYIGRKHEIINGIVQRIERKNIIVNLGQAEAILPHYEQIPGENFRQGDRVRALIVDVKKDSRDPQIVLSRTSPEFLINLFKAEVPEIGEGSVSIMGAAREPGVRAKIAVSSSSPDIDPIGACVGIKGSRVQNVVQELKGEKIDIILWHLDAAKFVCNALAPAEISRVIIDESNQAMEVIVPDNALSIAIGKRGQNVKLAAKITGWQLDVKSQSQHDETVKKGYQDLLDVLGMGESTAQTFQKRGYYGIDDVADATAEELMTMCSVGEEEAADLIEKARTALVNQTNTQVREAAQRGGDTETAEEEAAE